MIGAGTKAILFATVVAATEGTFGSLLRDAGQPLDYRHVSTEMYREKRTFFLSRCELFLAEATSREPRPEADSPQVGDEYTAIQPGTSREPEEPDSFSTTNPAAARRFAFDKRFPYPLGNEAARDEATKKAAEHRKAIRGMKIEWVVEIGGIEKDGTVTLITPEADSLRTKPAKLIFAEIPGADHAKPEVAIAALPEWFPEGRVPENMGRGRSPVAFCQRSVALKNVGKEEAAKLVPGAKVKLHGTLVCVITSSTDLESSVEARGGGNFYWSRDDAFLLHSVSAELAK